MLKKFSNLEYNKKVDFPKFQKLSPSSFPEKNYQNVWNNMGSYGEMNSSKTVW